MITLPTASLGTLKKFLTDHRGLMFQYIMAEISRGLDQHVQRVDLFKFGDTSFVAACRREEFVVVLNQAMDFFVNREMYEDAAKCRDLLTKTKVEDIIHDAQTE